MFFVCKQKTAYEMRISDWSSDVCSSDLPMMVKTAANPGGLPVEVFDSLRQQLAANRSQFYFDLASGPFYGFNRPGVKASQAIVQNWWRQGMSGGAKAHYDGVEAFSERSEEHTSELQSLMRISYAVF